MKLITILFGIVILPFILNAQSTYEQLLVVNKFWKNNYSYFKNTIPENIKFKNENEKIQFHLNNVIKELRSRETSFNTKQLKNRKNCLDILQDYSNKGIFPINLYHKNRTPYFIDHKNTACAVGHLVRETGFGKLANKIHKENNYGYIHDLVKQYPAITNWANAYGFTVDELAWIQPTYGPIYDPITFSDTTIIHPTCNNDGWFILDSNSFTTFTSPLTGYVINPLGTWPTNSDVPHYASGVYTIVVVDAFGMSASSGIIINNNLTTTIATVNSTCTQCDGSVTLNPIGGTAPYLYSLDNIIFYSNATTNNLCAGSYSYYITDTNGCTAQGSFNINSTNSLNATASITSPINCYGDSGIVTVSASGNIGSTTGTGVYSLTQGIHNFTVTDSLGCIDMVSINLTQPTQLNVNITNTPILCNGYLSTTTATASGGTPPYNYNIVCGTNGTNYYYAGSIDSFMVTDANGCISNPISHTITEPTNISNSAIITADNGIANGTINCTTTGGNPPYSYAWNNGDNTSNPDSLAQGIYMLQITDNSGCTSNFSYTVPYSSIQSINNTNYCSLNIFPNPSSNGLFNLKIANNIELNYFLVTDMAGKILSTQKFSLSNKLIDISNLNSGIYFAKIYNKQNELISTIKLIK